MTDKRRGGGEQRGAGARRRTGTWLTVEGDVVMEDADDKGRDTRKNIAREQWQEREKKNECVCPPQNIATCARRH